MSTILDDVREKIQDILQEVALLMETEGKFYCGVDKTYADQILALSGTTDIECPTCEGGGYFPNDDTGEPNPPVGGIRCPAWCDNGVIKHPWKVSVTMENGKLPEIPRKDIVHIIMERDRVLREAGYRQVVE